MIEEALVCATPGALSKELHTSPPVQTQPGSGSSHKLAKVTCNLSTREAETRGLPRVESQSGQGVGRVGSPSMLLWLMKHVCLLLDGWEG